MNHPFGRHTTHKGAVGPQAVHIIYSICRVDFSKWSYAGTDIGHTCGSPRTVVALIKDGESVKVGVAEKLSSYGTLISDE